MRINVVVEDAAVKGYDTISYWSHARDYELDWYHIPLEVRSWLLHHHIKADLLWINGKGNAIMSFFNPDDAMLFKLTWA